MISIDVKPVRMGGGSIETETIVEDLANKLWQNLEVTQSDLTGFQRSC